MRPDHRRIAKEQAVVRLERVDSDRQQRLDRLGQTGPVGRRQRELADEERVPCGALGDRSELLLGEREVAGRFERERACVVGPERLELEGRRPRPRRAAGPRGGA